MRKIFLKWRTVQDMFISRKLNRTKKRFGFVRLIYEGVQNVQIHEKLVD